MSWLKLNLNNNKLALFSYLTYNVPTQGCLFSTLLPSWQAGTDVCALVFKTAEFPGGIDSLFKFIRHNYRYTCMEGDDFSGTIYAEFIIEKDGRTSHAKIIKHLSANCDNEVLRVISIMPLWKAAQLNGRAVRTRYVVPLKFRLR